MTPTLHRAKYVLSRPDLLLENAAVSISEDGHILQVDSWNRLHSIPAAEVVDWGTAILMPGLINAHAHLELTDLHNRLNEFTSFTDNLEEVFENREQIEISKFYERLPKPTLIAIQEFMEGKVYYRTPDITATEEQ